jgi:OPA family sugar phosphate sensor protein UhpC-like MFS transporter
VTSRQARSPENKSRRIWQYRVFALTWLTYAGFYLCRKNISVEIPLLERHLGYSTDQLAQVVFVFSLLYATGNFVFGILSDRFGARVVVGVGLFVVVGVNILLGLQSSLFVLTLLALVGGAGQATGWSGLVKTMACWFKREERGVVMGWWGTNYVLGGFAATVFATFAATSPTFFPSLGWRRGFLFPALLLFFIAIVFVCCVPNKPSDVGLADIEEEVQNQKLQARDEHSLPARDTPGHAYTAIRELLTHRAIWVIGIMFFFLELTRYSFLFWLPLYMTERLRYSPGDAGYTSSLYELVGFSGAIMAGYASERLFQSRRFPVGCIMLCGLAAASLMQPYLASLGRVFNAVGISIIGIMTYGPDTLMSGAAAQDIGSAKAAATASGFIDGIGHIGQIASPFLVACITTRFGWDPLFYIFVALSLIGAGILATQWNYIPGSFEHRPRAGAVAQVASVAEEGGAE